MTSSFDLHAQITERIQPKVRCVTQKSLPGTPEATSISQEKFKPPLFHIKVSQKKGTSYSMFLVTYFKRRFGEDARAAARNSSPLCKAARASFPWSLRCYQDQVEKN
ncbi:hypothetical protein AV530_007141 [Patagioenas fasciata monilis]|uniref:Uncharacterized protein n=1 Tax=Patagioenas fasciata monilis TaxID=372326 RepID=A0A1V4L0X2_PATFA|nr:hypothetical protein AV530_007141 [Patagioenas fasciata monilis]